jgi:hypothetical protein
MRAGMRNANLLSSFLSIKLAPFALAGAALLAGGCAPGSPLPDGGDGTDDTDLGVATQYLFLGDYLTAEADHQRWRDIQSTLEAQFDEICGDTFCEGDFSNIHSLGFECSVSSKIGKVRECVWTFAASDELVDGASGSIAARVPFFECRVQPGARAEQLLAAFGDDPLHAELPGLGASLHDTLGDCFDSPVFVDEPLPEPSDGAFVNASDHLQGTDVDAWYEMTAALRQGFDEVCGDTFCEGDYPNLEPLRFRCSAEQGSGQIGECAWAFAGSYAERTKKGFITVEKAPFVCAFPVAASAAALAQALSPDACGEDPLRRALPGGTTSIYDALVDCL